MCDRQVVNKMIKYKTIKSKDLTFSSVLDTWYGLLEASHPSNTKFGWDYFPEALGKDYEDRSFFIVDGQHIIAFVPCGKYKDELSTFGGPIKIIFENFSKEASNEKIYQVILKNLILISKDCEKKLSVLGASENNFSVLDLVCLKLGATPRAQVTADVDLRHPEEYLKSNVRKSYKSLINWGKNNISLVYVNSQNKDFEKFETYRKFHCAIAGRETRSLRSWELMFQEICNGNGELSLGYVSEALVSGTLIIDGNEISVYASGVYDREKFENPISHWPVYNSILRSKKRNMKRFDLGIVASDLISSEKERAISFFKKGFATDFMFEKIWDLPK